MRSVKRTYLRIRLGIGALPHWQHSQTSCSPPPSIPAPPLGAPALGTCCDGEPRATRRTGVWRAPDCLRRTLPRFLLLLENYRNDRPKQGRNSSFALRFVL